MKPKHIFTAICITLFTATLSPAFATEPVYPVTNTETPASERDIMNRIEEIRKMDKSTLTRAEKKELRKELKTLKRADKKQGVYLSLGAIIIIGLLLIILL